LLVLAVLGLPLEAHQIPSLSVEALFSKDRTYLVRINVDPRLFLSAQPSSLPPVPVEWFRDQSDAEKKKTFETAEAYLKSLPPASLPGTASLPIWNSELYLEFHRGCYTNHTDQKRFNRRCEDTLYEAELFASLRTLFTGVAYPKAELEAAWKKVLFNQFHDILPGTSVPEAFVDANRDWQAALDTAWNTCQQAMQGLIAQVHRPPSPHPQARLVAVFNPLSWTRSEVVAVSAEQSQDERACFWQICDLSGKEIPSQPHCWREGGKTYCQIFFRIEIPAIGYRCVWLMPRRTGNPVPPVPGSGSGFVLENERLRVTVDPATGNLSALFDKLYKRDLLSAGSNQLQAFRDQGQYWDAWNIDPKYAQYPLPAAQLVQIFYEDKGAITTRIRVIRKIGQSTFKQLYVLDQGSAVLKIKSQVDWRERHLLVKAAFNFNMNANFATYEIPCGAIQRPTRPQTAAEKAKWEVSALRWAEEVVAVAEVVLIGAEAEVLVAGDPVIHGKAISEPS
jgi:alpha-mannosidase